MCFKSAGGAMPPLVTRAGSRGTPHSASSGSSISQRAGGRASRMPPGVPPPLTRRCVRRCNAACLGRSSNVNRAGVTVAAGEAPVAETVDADEATEIAPLRDFLSGGGVGASSVASASSSCTASPVQLGHPLSRASNASDDESFASPTPAPVARRLRRPQRRRRTAAPARPRPAAGRSARPPAPGVARAARRRRRVSPSLPTRDRGHS